MTNQMKAMFVIIFIFSFIVPALAMIRENRQCCHTFAPSSRKVQRKLVTSLEKKKVYSKHLERKKQGLLEVHAYGTNGGHLVHGMAFDRKCTFSSILNKSLRCDEFGRKLGAESSSNKNSMKIVESWFAKVHFNLFEHHI